jgi:predicted metal-binding membrane protein
MTPPDTPRSAYSLLPEPTTLAVVAAIVAVTIVAWWSTVDQADAMRGMVMGLGQIGVRAQATMPAGPFLVMWVTMMTAMMLPSAAPFILAHRAVALRRGDDIFSTFGFVGGYLLVWFAVGIVALLAYWAFAQMSDDVAQSGWLRAFAGAILIGAGVYQFTGLKQVCLDKCHGPFAFVVSHDFRGGTLGALRAGFAHGAYCVGCCWAMMAVLLVVGLMNLLWMAGVFAIFFIEKHWRHGIVVAKTAGAVLMLLGVVVAALPGVLQYISR